VSISLHLLNASGKLSPWERRIEDAFAQSIKTLSAMLPVKNVDVVVQAGTRVIPETGIGGFSPSGEVVYITIDPNHSNFPGVLGTEFFATLGHELHHCARHTGPGYGRTLGEALVTEGLATNFEAELHGGKAPFYACAVRGADLESLAQRARRELQSSNYDHRAWFFGSAAKGFPRYSGYSLGFSIVAAYISRHALFASQLCAIPAENVLVEAFADNA
jgi:uncharacterized protein YjaZ